MKTHTLKIQKQYFDQVLKGNKRFELRKNDRNYKPGDLIHFIDPDTNDEFPSERAKSMYRITYVLKNVPESGLLNGYCVLSIAPLTPFSAPSQQEMEDFFNEK